MNAVVVAEATRRRTYHPVTRDRVSGSVMSIAGELVTAVDPAMQ